MPPKITRVRWKADNIPYGLEFNENTGIFTGTPEDEGEYVVPVTVETNYGEDTKDVKIIVEKSNSYGLYVYPNHVWWGTKDVKRGTLGFYSVDIPEVEKLSEYPYGFRAYTQSGNVYGCGLTGVPTITKSPTQTNSSNKYTVSSQITNIGAFASLNNIRAVDFSKSLYYSYPIANTIISCAMVTSDNKMTLSHVLSFSVQTAIGSERTTSYLSTVNGEKIKNLPVSDVGWNDNGIAWISEYGNQYCYVKYSLTGVNTINAKAYATVVTENLWYKAIKIINSTSFKCLSEDRLLDNTPENFTHGTIKDVWGYKTLVYVQTTDNQLYEYAPSSNLWDFLGTYDVKKIELLNDKCILMLTNDGKLYHKGPAITSSTYNSTTTIINGHLQALTHIFPTQNFIDFTFSHEQGENGICGSLLVLKE